MSPQLKKLQSEAMKLSVQDRARLAEQLLKSLDELTEHEVEQVWWRECTRRYKNWQTGKTKTVSAKQMFKKARESRV